MLKDGDAEDLEAHEVLDAIERAAQKAAVTLKPQRSQQQLKQDEMAFSVLTTCLAEHLNPPICHAVEIGEIYTFVALRNQHGLHAGDKWPRHLLAGDY